MDAFPSADVATEASVRDADTSSVVEGPTVVAARKLDASVAPEVSTVDSAG